MNWDDKNRYKNPENRYKKFAAVLAVVVSAIALIFAFRIYSEYRSSKTQPSAMEANPAVSPIMLEILPPPPACS